MADGFTNLFSCSRCFVFLRHDDLEVSMTLCRWIYRLVGKDNRRAWGYDLLGIRQELSRQAAFLRRQEKALARTFFAFGCYFYPAKMSVRICSLESAENTIVQS